MRTEKGKIEGDVYLNSELDFTGIVTGNMTVAAGGVLNMRGMCIEDLSIEKGAVVYIRGTVGGNVLNNGGYLEVYGTIAGYLHTTEDGNTFVDADAVINQ